VQVPEAEATARIEAVTEEVSSDAAPGSPAPGDMTVDLGTHPPPGGDEPIRLADDGDATKPRIPEKLGRYQIINEIARGGMGVVYRARDPKLGRVVALKVLLAGEGAGRETIARFIREARSAAGLKHPGIVQVHDFGETGGQHYFTMDYVEGRPLDRVAEAGELPPRRALEVILSVARALEFAHERGIIHRDLKPANILVTADGTPVLTDFGLAKEVGDTGLSMTGTIFGTPAYMSPEQAQGRSAEIDGRSDVYSLGSVLYELLTGMQPFSGETIYDVITQVITVDPPPPAVVNRELDADLSTICLKALEKEPFRRYQTIGEMADDIQSHLSGGAISARPLGAGEKLVRAARKNARVIAWALGAAAAAAVLALGAWALFGRDRLDEFAESLGSSDAELRLAATENLAAEMAAGRLDGDDLARAEGMIVRRLNDGDRRVRLAALKVVDERDLQAGGEALLKMVRADPDEEVRLAAVRCRLPRPPKGIVPALLEIARDPAEPRELRLAAVRAVGPLAGLAVKIPLVRLKLANQADRALCLEIDRALANIAPRSLMLRVYHIAESGEALEAASGAISKLIEKDNELARLIDEIEGEEDPTPRPKKREPLALVLRKLRGKDPAERIEAAHDLGVIGHRDCLKPLLGALRDPEAEVALAAAEAAAPIFRAEREKDVVAVLRDAKLPAGCRGAAAHLLGRAEVRSAAAPIAAALGAEKNVPAAVLMASALGRLKVAAGVEPALVAALSDGAPPLRTAAAEALGRIGARSRETVGALVKAADDPHKPAAAAARAALSSITGKDHDSPAAWREWWSSARSSWK
jgi:tRNA A-37 threonylcarbamoyl transferase component Bud32/HEAT repeat protein